MNIRSDRLFDAVPSVRHYLINVLETITRLFTETKLLILPLPYNSLSQQTIQINNLENNQPRSESQSNRLPNVGT